MKELNYDAIVIGAGAAGMAAALELERAGKKCALVEREDHLGGILIQCVHNGFGLQEFKEELTGPEFAERLAEQVAASAIDVFLGTTVVSFRSGSASAAVGSADADSPADWKELVCISPDQGVMRVLCRAVVLAMGSRERNRGNVRIPGARPAGIYTAGLAQRLVNIEGYVPGRNVVIIGSGDIGLIMARRMSWIGCSVKAVVEIMPYPAGLNRNIVQCLEDFNIPLYLSCQTTNVYGNDRVEGIEVTPMENGSLLRDKAFRIDCDTLLLSVGLVPENELSRAAGVELHPTTGGPLVDANLMTTVDGVFACGNVLHIHDLVDWVAEEARNAGRYAAAWLDGVRAERQLKVRTGANVRYVNPGRVDATRENRLYLRSLVVKDDATLEVSVDGKPIKTVRKSHVQPSEMIIVTLGPKDLERLESDATLELAIN